MRTLILAVVLAISTAAVAQDKPDEFCPKCAGLKSVGTTVHFAETPKQAQRLAKQHGKLVFLLHVSGNFGKEEFT
jgi:hypothetical protein